MSNDKEKEKVLKTSHRGFYATLGTENAPEPTRNKVTDEEVPPNRDGMELGQAKATLEPQAKGDANKINTLENQADAQKPAHSAEKIAEYKAILMQLPGVISGPLSMDLKRK
ncbi:MAG: hypothetical protein PHS57_03515 [Alphaproteobacteria bacterium]|nr:hypothetical protein [Alphaproteobacteria bacterium]